MKNTIRIALTGLILILTLSTVTADQNLRGNPYNVGGLSLNLITPPNYCLMDPNNKSDKIIIDGTRKSVAGRNDLLTVFVDCKELQDWRTGKQKYLNHFGNYQIPTKNKSTSYIGQEAALVKGVCDYFTAQGKKFTDMIKDESNKAIQKAWKNIKLNETRMLGTFHQDGTSCVAGMFQRMQTDDKSIKDQVSIFSVGIIKGRMIFTYLFAPNDETNIVGKLINMIKKNHTGNLNANKTENPPPQ